MQNLNASLISCLDGLGCISIFNQFLPGALGEDVFIDGRQFRILKLVRVQVFFVSKGGLNLRICVLEARRRWLLFCVPRPRGASRGPFSYRKHVLCIEKGEVLYHN